MTTYFTATTDDDAVGALRSPPTGDEVLTSAIAPDGDQFQTLIELVTGKQLDELKSDDYAVHDDIASDARQSLIRLGSALVTDIANRDATQFADLAEPWAGSAAFEEAGEVDLVDFLTNLQHLCRNATATNGRVYATETF